MTDQHDDVLDDLFTDDDDREDTTRRRPPPSRRWRILATVSGVMAVGAIGFAVGRTTADSTSSAADGLPAGFELPAGDDVGTGGAGGPGGGFGGGFVTGELTAIDDDEWLVTDSSGNTIRVRVSDETSYRKTETVTEDDVAIGDSVTVIGEEQDDGSVDADTVQSGDSAGFGGPPAGVGARAPGGSPSAETSEPDGDPPAGDAP